MLWGFILGLALVAGPLAAGLALMPGLRGRAHSALPIGLCLSTAMGGIAASLLGRAGAGGATLYLGVLFLGGGGSVLALRAIERRGAMDRLCTGRRLGRRIIIGAMLLAALAVADNAMVLARQGLTGGHGHVPYFRVPFMSDNYRNEVIVNAMLRGDENPFLEGAPLVYQVFWHRLAASAVGVLEGPHRYHQVQGVGLVTAWTAYLLIFWALATLAPGMTRPRIAIPLGLLLTLHADIYSMLASLMIHGGPGIEADASFLGTMAGNGKWYGGMLALRGFSLDLMTLTAPQHAMFLIFGAAFAVGMRRRIKWLEAVSLAGGVLASPVLAGFFFPLAIACGALGLAMRRGVRDAVSYAVFVTTVLAGAALLYNLVLGYPVWALVLRQKVGGVREAMGWAGYAAWPLALIATMGMQGAQATLALAWQARVRGIRAVAMNPWALALILAALVFGYATGNPEVRRHGAMACSLFGALYLATAMGGRRWVRSRAMMAALHATLALALALHLYTVYSFTAKRNFLSPDINYADYLCMNERIASRYPNLSVLAAYEHSDVAVMLPIVMEVATSFMLHDATYVHSGVDEGKASLLREVMVPSAAIVWARELGYTHTLWGPLEQRAWGRIVYEWLLGPTRAVEQCGDVRLYAIPAIPYGVSDKRRITFDLMSEYMMLPGG